MSRTGPDRIMKYRELRIDEYELLKDFLYEAIFIPEEVEAPERSIIELPELALYYDGFGEGSADHCMVADDDGRVVGAVWSRVMDDYGHIDDETPSLAMSVLKEYRNKGIGTQLLREFLLFLKKQGCRRASLSVQKANYAAGMYEKAGFVIIDENDEEYLMVRELQR